MLFPREQDGQNATLGIHAGHLALQELEDRKEVEEAGEAMCSTALAQFVK